MVSNAICIINTKIQSNTNIIFHLKINKIKLKVYNLPRSPFSTESIFKFNVFIILDEELIFNLEEDTVPENCTNPQPNFLHSHITKIRPKSPAKSKLYFKQRHVCIVVYC